MIFLVLEPDHKIKNVAKLIAYATIPSLELIRRKFDNSDSITFKFRVIGDNPPWILSVVMQNANECVNELVKHLKDKGFTTNKDY